MTPILSKAYTFIAFTYFDTPLGKMVACATADGISKLCFCDETNPVKTINESPYFDVLYSQLFEYFEGTRKQFEIPLVFSGTHFQKCAWQQLLNIPYGLTRSYKQQAISLGNVLAIRAVAHANGQNPIALIVPCHRVIGENGKLTGYAGGLWRKKWLLEHEAIHAGYKRNLFV